MLKIFKQMKDTKPPRVPSQFKYVKNNIIKNTEFIMNYWRRMNWVVRNEHILVGLIHELGSISKNPLDIYESIRNNSMHSISVRNIISPLHYGKLYNQSYFYGKPNKELYIEIPFDDSIEQIFTKHYSKWEPIRVVYHPFTSFDHQLPNGKPRNSGENGLCIIKIDLGLLFAQFCMWKNDYAESRYEDGTYKSIGNFIHSYPIVNMMKSHNEIVWFNRMINLAKGEYNSDIKVDNRIGMPTTYTNLDEVHEKLIEEIEKGEIDFNNILSEIPGIYTKNLLTFLKQDNFLYTQQIKLPYCLFLLPYIKWLLELELSKGRGGNRQFITDLIRKDREYYNSKTYGTIKGMPFKEVNKYIEDNIVSLAKTL